MKLLIDSDFLFGLFVLHDPHHDKTNKIFKKLIEKKEDLVALNIVVQETATVLSKKAGQAASLDFLERFVHLPLKILVMDESLESDAWEVFKKHTKKGTSFVDCANLAALEKYKFDGILSFDEFYQKKVRINS